MLREEVFPLISGSPNGASNDDIWMQDGAGPHTAAETIALLGNTFQMVISKNSSFIEWPPSSPDLNPCDYFLWGYAKREYKKFETIAQYQPEFENQMALITTDLVRKAIESWPDRLMHCVVAEGGHFLD